jgi:5'-methylthioadenosine phosphorylase
MSALPEAKLAREAEMAYQMICMATDYDCWRADEPDAEQQHGGGSGGSESASADVTVEIVMRHMRANAGNARRFVAAVLDELSNVAAGAGAGAAGADDGEQNAVIMARHLEGQSRAATLMTAAPGRKPEAVAKIQWLFPDYFPED